MQVNFTAVRPTQPALNAPLIARPSAAGAILARLREAECQGPEPVLQIAREVQIAQMERARQEWRRYQLWEDDAGNLLGVINPDGVHRRVQPSHSGTHWHCSSPYMSAISGINSALTRLAFRYPQRAAEVESVRPNPKQANIAWALREARRREDCGLAAYGPCPDCNGDLVEDGSCWHCGSVIGRQA